MGLYAAALHPNGDTLPTGVHAARGSDLEKDAPPYHRFGTSSGTRERWRHRQCLSKFDDASRGTRAAKLDAAIHADHDPMAARVSLESAAIPAHVNVLPLSQKDPSGISGPDSLAERASPQCTADRRRTTNEQHGEVLSQKTHVSVPTSLVVDNVACRVIGSL